MGRVARKKKRNRVGLNLFDCFQLHAGSPSLTVKRFTVVDRRDRHRFRWIPLRLSEVNWTFFIVNL